MVRLAVLLFAAAGLGCASGAERDSRAAPPGPELAAARQRELAAAEALYRAGDPGFAAERDRLARDRASAYWLTRMLVRDILVERDRGESVSESSATLQAKDIDQALRQGGANDDQALLAAVARPATPLWTRATEQLRALGPAAMPALEQDLLRSRFGDRRQLGVEIAVVLGLPVVPALASLLGDGDGRVRRGAVEAVAGMAPDSATLAVLGRASEDAEFGVRAAALRAWLRHGGDGERLRRAVASDSDPFVRRTAAAQLGAVADRPAAECLVAYLRGCVASGDAAGAAAADQSLRRISGHARAGDVAFWSAWLATWEKR